MNFYFSDASYEALIPTSKNGSPMYSRRCLPMPHKRCLQQLHLSHAGVGKPWPVRARDKC